MDIIDTKVNSNYSFYQKLYQYIYYLLYQLSIIQLSFAKEIVHHYLFE